MNTHKKDYDNIKRVIFLYSEIKKLSIEIENEVYKKKAETRDEYFEEYNSLLKQILNQYRFFPLKYITNDDMVKMRKVKDADLKRKHLIELKNFKKINDQIEVDAGDYVIMPKLDGISIICWNDKENDELMYLTRGNNECGIDKTVLINYCFPELTSKLRNFFTINKKCIGVRGELILDNNVKSYGKYLRIYNKNIKEKEKGTEETKTKADFNKVFEGDYHPHIINADDSSTEMSVEFKGDPESIKEKREAQLKVSNTFDFERADENSVFYEVENEDIEKPNTDLSDFVECNGRYCIDRKDKNLDPFHTIFFTNFAVDPILADFWVLKSEVEDDFLEGYNEDVYTNQDFDIFDLMLSENSSYIVDWGTFKNSGKKKRQDKHCTKTLTEDIEFDMSQFDNYYFLGRKKLSDKPSKIPSDYSKMLIVTISENFDINSYEVDFEGVKPTDAVYLEINYDIILRRELMSGLANRKEITSYHDELRANCHLLFYQFYKSKNNLTEDIKLLEDLGVEIAPTLTKTFRKNKLLTTEYVNTFIDKYIPKKYDCDGIVFRPDNNKFDEIIGLKKTVLVHTNIKKIKWKKSPSGSVRPICEINPIYFNKKSFVSINMFSFESVVNNMYSNGDLIEVKFVADHPVLNRNLTSKNITVEKFKDNLLKNFDEEVWVSGAHLYINMDPICWFILKLSIPKLKTDSLDKFLKCINLDKSTSIITFLKTLRELNSKLYTIKLPSMKTFIIQIIEKVMDTSDSKLTLYSIQLPGIQETSLNQAIDEGLFLEVGDDYIVKSFSFKNEAVFEKNPTLQRLKPKLKDYFKHFNFFIKFKRSLIKDEDNDS
ncbi:NAD+ dependent DNA ligase [Carp edema virus]|nr:NAD+ dependent DNA ligase [Carp edema virus]